MFSLKLFGEVSLEGSDGRLTGRVVQRQRLALLALLASDRCAGMGRDKLAAFLWPESEAERGRALLSNSVYVLRQTMGDEAIVGSGDGLRLNPDIVHTDTAEFEEALARGAPEHAALLYRGPFLDGFYLPDAGEFERWSESERQRLARLYSRALELLAETRERAGDPRSAVQWWQRLAAHDPYNSGTALRLMRALADAGNPAGAIRHARLHEMFLRQEIGVGPTAEVLALTERLRSEQADLHGSAEPTSLDRIRPEPPLERAQREIAHEGVVGSRPPPPPTGVPRRRVAVVVGAVLAALLAAGALATPWLGGAPPDPGSVTRQPHAAPRTVDPAAHELYLRGRNAWNERSRQGLERAVVYFRQAVDRDPTYAEAYAGLADAYVILGYLGFGPADAMFPKGKAAALRALELDSTLAAAFAPLGQALTWERDWPGAEMAFRRAIELDPGHATAHQWYGLLLVSLGRIEEGVEHTHTAAELDPLSLQINNTHGMLLHYAGRSDAALRHYQKIIHDEPDSRWVRQNPWLFSNASRVYAAQGRYGDAIRMLDQALTAVPQHPRALWDLASVHAAQGRVDEALRVFSQADSTSGQYAYFRAAVFAVVGQPDSAFHWWDRVEEWGPSPMAELRMDPRLASIRSDPRYHGLLTRLGL
jgi:DNA-binding SARP family transcriptional activator/Tfp pilus assembly protein PilF